MVKLVLEQERHSSGTYRVVQMENTVEFNVRQRLTRRDVESIMERRGSRAVKVVIK